MNNEENNAFYEHLQYIKYKQDRIMDELRQTGKLNQYILDLHKEMILKYPEMIVQIYTREEIDEDNLER